MQKLIYYFWNMMSSCNGNQVTKRVIHISLWVRIWSLYGKQSQGHCTEAEYQPRILYKKAVLYISEAKALSNHFSNIVIIISNRKKLPCSKVKKYVKSTRLEYFWHTYESMNVETAMVLLVFRILWWRLLVLVFLYGIYTCTAAIFSLYGHSKDNISHT